MPETSFNLKQNIAITGYRERRTRSNATIKRVDASYERLIIDVYRDLRKLWNPWHEKEKLQQCPKTIRFRPEGRGSSAMDRAIPLSKDAVMEHDSPAKTRAAIFGSSIGGDEALRMVEGIV